MRVDASRWLLKTFTAFCEADDEYRVAKILCPAENQWPNSLLALNPGSKFFRQSLESYLKKGKIIWQQSVMLSDAIDPDSGRIYGQSSAGIGITDLPILWRRL